MAVYTVRQWRNSPREKGWSVERDGEDFVEAYTKERATFVSKACNALAESGHDLVVEPIAATPRKPRQQYWHGRSNS